MEETGKRQLWDNLPKSVSLFDRLEVFAPIISKAIKKSTWMADDQYHISDDDWDRPFTRMRIDTDFQYVDCTECPKQTEDSIYDNWGTKVKPATAETATHVYPRFTMSKLISTPVDKSKEEEWEEVWKTKNGWEDYKELPGRLPDNWSRRIHRYRGSIDPKYL